MAKILEYSDPLYYSELSSIEHQTSGGVLLGTLFNLHKKRALGLDLNLGIFYKHRSITTHYFENNVLKTKQEEPFGYGVKFGINLYGWTSIVY